MFKLIKYLKQFSVAILAIVTLLVVQAICDLSLPDYTSKIVNVGIQQGGIEQPTPEVIRKTTLDKLSLFMTETDYQKVLDAYELIQQGDSLKEKYKALESEPIYLLKTDDKTAITELNEIFAKPMLIVSGLETGSNEMKAFEENN